MIYPMRVLDKNGKFVRIISSKELQKEYWDKYWEKELSKSFTSDQKSKKLNKKNPDQLPQAI